jgi:hypothetical protein
MNVSNWGGTALTGRDISGDTRALVDDTIKGLLRSIGDAGASPGNISGQTMLYWLKNIDDRVTKLVANVQATVHNTAITAATNILASAISPSDPPSIFRIFVAIDTAGVFSARITNGSATVGVNFNGGSSLAANAGYIFDILVHSGDSVNFQHSASGTLLVLRVAECRAGTQ